jgi:hypothetical protein
MQTTSELTLQFDKTYLPAGQTEQTGHIEAPLREYFPDVQAVHVLT